MNGQCIVLKGNEQDARVRMLPLKLLAEGLRVYEAFLYLNPRAQACYLI